MSSDPATPDPRLKRNARLGLIALGLRTALENLTVLCANVFLARQLAPGDYGIFGMLHFTMTFFRLVSDTGLGAALVRKESEPDEAELSSLWWLQLGLGLVVLALSCAAVPLIRRVWPTMPAASAWLLPALMLSLSFSMLQSVPFLVLERQVRFGRVSTLEFVGTLGFYGTAVVMAARGAGAAALVWASVAQSALISVGAHFVQPWRPRFIFRLDKIRGLLRFGGALQGTQLVGYTSAAVTPLLVGARLGKDVVGVVQFAETTAFFPTQIVGMVRRVYFPYLSRLQGNRAEFTAAFERAVLLAAVPSYFFCGLFLGGAKAVISIIYGGKWLVSLPALYVYSLGFCAVFFSWIAEAALLALNLASTLLRIVTICCALNWGATLIATLLGSTPFAFSLGFVVHLLVSPLLMLRALRPHMPTLRLWPRLRGLLLAATVTALLGRALLRHVTGVASLVGWIVVAVLAFSSCALALDPELRAEVARYWAQRRSKAAVLAE